MIWIYRYSDIIQESFYDTYLNLTLKSVMLLKWVSTHCSQVTFVLKTDDDMFVNIPALVEHLTQPDIRNRKDLILGSLFCRARPIKDQNSKWYSPQFMFSGKEYPDYVSGTGYIMSGHLVPILFESAMQVPLFHLEDVFITGNYDQSSISGGVPPFKGALKNLRHSRRILEVFVFGFLPCQVHGEPKDFWTIHK